MGEPQTKYRKSDKGRESRRRYRLSDKGRAAAVRYALSNKGKARRYDARLKHRAAQDAQQALIEDARAKAERGIIQPIPDGKGGWKRVDADA